MITVEAVAVPFEQDLTLPCRSGGVDPEWWYADHDLVAVAAAKERCEECPRRAECLRAALERKEKFGIFAGYTTAERNELLRKAAARRRRPRPPGRYGDPGVIRKGHDVDLVNLRRLFTAARACVKGGESRRGAASRLGVNIGHMSDVALVVRWAPDVADDVESGRVPLGAAVRYARSVRDWTVEQEQGDAA